MFSDFSVLWLFWGWHINLTDWFFVSSWGARSWELWQNVWSMVIRSHHVYSVSMVPLNQTNLADILLFLQSTNDIECKVRFHSLTQTSCMVSVFSFYLFKCPTPSNISGNLNFFLTLWSSSLHPWRHRKRQWLDLSSPPFFQMSKYVSLNIDNDI